ncbi:MAG: L-rhamnose mutarotase [Caldilineaceae bacterium SB0670_bin_27]|uniref:L-rhamnose mutarotase n=1 Tax=Caldilineaceae bacterium SB0664_bin_27 TaxID=2605260 RepID=A0A6B0YV45_9CHLR|nr:L-rhamnose mutarotase [Caldilineaceae bacterium]MDE0339901.1 L-rhamnose mutarotase [Caldilineaceae bacterium]MXY94994.1 L-rhamnose mutarotase [Caldilineaceae bacterium SB0664_bin_27]MYJ77464.1 L-rhamnose mutarotase [Caldilineaceae bacterium SB0670_bin_27]
MKCYGLTINLKDDPEVIEQYKAYHRQVWPEVLEQARNLGICKTRIFLIGRRLFMYIETEDGFDFGRAFSAPGGGAARLREWDDLMRGFQEPAPEAQTGEWWAQMELVHSV